VVMLKKWFLLLPVAVLAAAVGLQALNPYREVAAPKPKHLAAAVPTDVPGWRCTEVPLGPNEFVSDKVSEVLRYDDVLNREYRRGAVKFGVYAAYWGAGKMPTRLVASHTPDRCWTENGWTCQEMRFKQRRKAGGQDLQLADWREFRDPQGGITFVIFWHLIEGRVYDYGERFNAVPHPLEWWKDAVAQAVHGSREQYFIRVTCSVPFEQVWDDPGIQEIMSGLAKVGLAERAAAPPP
jgi:hypothetical protein